MTTALLIPGGCHGWCFDRLLPHLGEVGVPDRAIDPPYDDASVSLAELG
jgi:hypothetical protein